MKEITDRLKEEYKQLINLKDKNKIIDKLQKIMALFLRNCYLEVNCKKVKPIEVEAYYYKKDIFEDEYMHRDELQHNNFGKPYFHKNENGSLKTGTRKGMDICLSDADAYFSLLIRSAEIDKDKYYGPCICVEGIFGKENNMYKQYTVELKQNTEPDDKSLYYGIRYGLSSKYESYKDLKLRMIKGEFDRDSTVKIKSKRDFIMDKKNKKYNIYKDF